MPFLSVLEAAALGLLQGVTEFLPISSTGHLILLQQLFGLDQQVYGLSFDMFTNLGTTVALVAYFWRDLVALVRNVRWPRPGHDVTPETKQVGWILGATLVVALVGLLIEDTIATDFRSPELVSWMFILFALVMLLAEYRAARRPQQPLSTSSAYAMGLAQAIALIPGVSRSGISISAGLMAGLDRVTAARFSFLLSLPITVAAIGKRLLTAQSELAGSLTPEIVLFYTVGILTAGLAAYATIHYLLRFLSKYSLAVFAYYRILLGVIVLLTIGLL